MWDMGVKEGMKCDRRPSGCAELCSGRKPRPSLSRPMVFLGLGFTLGSGENRKN